MTVSKELISWPTSKGDPIGPVWSYGGMKGMYQAEALRLFAHDLVDRIKEFELPVREAMKLARGDGLDAFAYCKMLQTRLNGKECEIERLTREAEDRSQYVSHLEARLRAAGPSTLPPAVDSLLCDVAQLLDGVKQTAPQDWTAWDQSVREQIAALRATKPTQADLAMVVGARADCPDCERNVDLTCQVERLQRREYVTAQHEESGRYWSGPHYSSQGERNDA